MTLAKFSWVVPAVYSAQAVHLWHDIFREWVRPRGLKWDNGYNFQGTFTVSSGHSQNGTDAMSTNTPNSSDSPEETSFAETALKLGGKSDDEARRTGAIDKADDQVEALFAPQYQTVNSPSHRAVWDRGVPAAEFVSPPPKTPADVQEVMDNSVAVVERHCRERSLMHETS